MATIPFFIPPIWGAMPPEVNTSRLMTGAGAAPMLQTAAGWEALAIELETQADELMASVNALQGLWTGTAAESAVAATIPMILWLRMLSLQALKRAAQAGAQAASYTTAALTTPQMFEIELNHVTHAVLESTNFMEINRLPITLTELDYQRMWDLAAEVMGVYEGHTTVNATFEPISPPKPVVIPGMVESAQAFGLSSGAMRAPAAMARNATFTKVSGEATVQTVGVTAGGAVAAASQPGILAEDDAKHASTLGQSQDQMMQQGMQQGVSMATQLASSVGQMPQQAMQGVSQPFQQLTQPLQQMTSIFSGMGGDKGAQVGLMGAPPFSNHPAIGGSGAGVGAGLVRAASLPGAGGSSARTPLMVSLVGSPAEPAMSPVSVAAGAGAGPGAAGLAPVGAGGAGGSGPMGMTGRGAKSGGSKPGLMAPAPLEHDLDEDEEDDW